MAPRPFWKGYLKLSLVTCAVAMTPAISESEKMRFHTVNRATGHRVRSRYVDAETNKPVPDDQQVKGYETAEHEYVMLEDEEIDAVALESTRTVDIDAFVPRDSIGWIWYDRPHYLTPDDKVGEEAFAVIRDAMASTDVVGVSRLVLYRRERSVMLEPRGKGIILWTLRYGDEVRDAQDYFAGLKDEKADPAATRLIKSLIDDRKLDWDPSMLRDPVQERLKEIVAAKRRKRPARKRDEKPAPIPETAGNVVSIMDALRRSIEGDKKPGTRSK